MPIKGSVLLARNARAVSDRYIADVDILVQQAHWKEAVDLAMQDGWSIGNGLSRDAVVHRMGRINGYSRLPRSLSCFPEHAAVQ